MPEDVTQGAERDRRLPEAWEEDAAMSKRARVGGGITASRLNKPNSSFFSFSNLGRRFRHSSTSTGTWRIGQCIAMTATEAPWRVKSRPCPFYQQGKCLFADSCNFLHNVQIKVPGGPTAIHASPATEALQRTPEGPAVIVDSPRSMRSPPRSPRMNSLLQALKGVISEDDSEDDSEDSGSEPAASSAEDVGMEEPAEREAPDAPNEQDRRASQPPSAAHQDDYNDSQEVTARQSIPVALHEDREQSPEYEEDSSHSTNSAPTPDILSPVDLSHLRLSGLDQFVHAKGNNSFDSGYAENWQSPQRFALSPPRSPSVVSTFGLLSSPFGSPSERVFGSPRAHMFGNIPSSPLATGANAFSHDENEQEDSDVARLDLEDLDSPQDYTASIASSNMTLEAATDVTEDYSFDAGEGSGVTDLWDAYGQPTAMYASSDAGADALAEEQEEDVVDAYGQPTPLLPGPGDVQEAFDDADDANSSFGSIAANRISFSEADAQSTFHGPPPPQGLPPADDYTEDELSVPQTWNESPRELATPVFNLPSDLSEHDIVTDYEQMSPEQRHGDESSSDFTADLSAYEATELSASGAAGMVTDDTAELAYLASPTMRPGDNDTLQNLYDHYSVASSSSSPETGVGEVRDLDEMTEAPSSPNGHYADAFEERHDVFEEQPDAFDGRPETFVERKITSEHRAHTFDERPEDYIDTSSPWNADMSMPEDQIMKDASQLSPPQEVVNIPAKRLASDEIADISAERYGSDGATQALAPEAPVAHPSVETPSDRSPQSTPPKAIDAPPAEHSYYDDNSELFMHEAETAPDVNQRHSEVHPVEARPSEPTPPAVFIAPVEQHSDDEVSAMISPESEDARAVNESYSDRSVECTPPQGSPQFDPYEAYQTSSVDSSPSPSTLQPLDANVAEQQHPTDTSESPSVSLPEFSQCSVAPKGQPVEDDLDVGPMLEAQAIRAIHSPPYEDAVPLSSNAAPGSTVSEQRGIGSTPATPSSSRVLPVAIPARQSLASMAPAPSPLDAFRQRAAVDIPLPASPIDTPASKPQSPFSRPPSRVDSPHSRPASRAESPFSRPASRAASAYSRPASRAASSSYSRPASRAASPVRRPVFTPPPIVTRGRSGTIKPASRESSLGNIVSQADDDETIGATAFTRVAEATAFVPSSQAFRTVDYAASAGDVQDDNAMVEDSISPRTVSGTFSPRGRSGTMSSRMTSAVNSPQILHESLSRVKPDAPAGVGIAPQRMSAIAGPSRSANAAVFSSTRNSSSSSSLHSVPPSPNVIALNSPLSSNGSAAPARVPFASRSSFVLGSARDSSLLLNRAAGKSPSASPQGSSVSMDESLDDQILEEFPAPPSNPKARGLKPLRLSMILQSKCYSPSPSPSPLSRPLSRTSSIPESPAGHLRRFSAASSVSSRNSLSDNNFLLSSARSSLIPGNAHNMIIPNDSPSGPSDDVHATPIPRSAPPSRTASWRFSRQSMRSADHSPVSDVDHASTSRLSLSVPPAAFPIEEDDDYTIRRPVSRPASSASYVLPSPSHAIATPRPTLMFAIASDDVEEVRRVLESGEAGPNDPVGPQSALSFALSNDQLKNKLEIVKTLLAYGADPTGLTQSITGQKQSRRSSTSGDVPLPAPVVESLDPATKYYVARADDPVTRKATGLLNRSFFRPLARGLNYQLIGQDRALEQLYRVLSIHSQQSNAPPVVVMLCGPSGLGKSFLAHKFGALLDVPTHTVNMTAINTPRDLWQSHSLSSRDEEPTDQNLSDFLIANEKKRCVVVLDEIEKVQDEKTLWTLLMPWELGRCSFEAGGRTVDTRNVVWIGTSNLGHDLVFEHHDARDNVQKTMAREEYSALMALLRPRISDRLGASLVSRITAMLPFVPFTDDEKRALAAESLYSIMGEGAGTLEPSVVNSIVNGALADYSILEGARSLYRSVSYQLVDAI